jgi:type IV secretion system protein TrbL
VSTFANATTGWITNVMPIATALFWSLAGIDFTWTCITLVLQHDDLKSWMAGFIKKILTIGFFAALLQNGQTWIAAIINFFISAGGTVGGTSISSTDLNPSNIMAIGIGIAGDMITGGPGGHQGSNAMSIFTNPVGTIGTALLMDAGAIMMILCYVVIALHFVMAMVEAYVTIGAGYIFLGFGGSRWTVPYTEKYLGMVVHAGVRIMVLEMMIGLGKTLAPEWDKMAITCNNTPSLLGNIAGMGGATGSSTYTGVQLLFALMASMMIFAMCCWTIPQIAANVASGGLSMSGGDMVGSAVAAGTMGFAAGHFATTAGTGTGSQMGNSKDVENIASAAAMKGAEMGVQMALAAATGGSSAVASGVVEASAAAGGAAAGSGAAGAAASSVTGGGEAAVVGLTPEAPSGSDAGCSSGASEAPAGGDVGNAAGAAEGPGSGEAVNGAGTPDAPGSGDAGSGPGSAAASESDEVASGGGTPDAPSVGASGSGTRAPGSGSSSRSAQDKDMFDHLNSLHKGFESALGKLPDDGGRMGGVTPKVDHGE